jgi:hypothetical protein
MKMLAPAKDWTGHECTAHRTLIRLRIIIDSGAVPVLGWVYADHGVPPCCWFLKRKPGNAVPPMSAMNIDR